MSDIPSNPPRPQRGLRVGLRTAFLLLGLGAAFFAGWATRHREVEHLRQAAEAQQALTEQERTARHEAEAARREAESARQRLEAARVQYVEKLAQRTDRGRPPEPAAEAARTAPEDVDNPDERLRQLVVGTWHDDYQGRRTMTLRADGTGTMVVELTGVQAALFAPRLQFEMEWSIEDGRLKKQTLRGEPATQVQLILATMGDRVDEPILELTADRLLLLDKDGQTRYDWRRPP